MSNCSYVLFWGKEDYYRIAFTDVFRMNNVMYIPRLPNSSNMFIQNIHKYHNSTAINKIIQLPFKDLWHRVYSNSVFPEHGPIVFIFHASYYWLRGNDYFHYLRRIHPTCKLVYVFMDTIESYRAYFENRFREGFDLDYIKNTFDLIISYNKNDCGKDIIYYPSIYSNINQLYCYTDTDTDNADVFFVGRAKDRLNDIHDIYNCLSKKGFKCDFYISGVEKKNQIGCSNIHYNTEISYESVIKHVAKARGVLEVIQKKSLGFTYRLNEALVFDKNLITDNPIVDYTPYSQSNKLYKVKDIKEIQLDCYRKIAEEKYGYKNEYSPKKFFDFLYSILFSQTGVNINEHNRTLY